MMVPLMRPANLRLPRTTSCPICHVAHVGWVHAFQQQHDCRQAVLQSGPPDWLLRQAQHGVAMWQHAGIQEYPLARLAACHSCVGLVGGGEALGIRKVLLHEVDAGNVVPVVLQDWVVVQVRSGEACSARTHVHVP
jgi:hypothetical protein